MYAIQKNSAKCEKSITQQAHEKSMLLGMGRRRPGKDARMDRALPWIFLFLFCFKIKKKNTKN